MFKLDYLNSHLSSGYSSLYTGRTLQLAGYSLIGLFLPIYLLIAFGQKIEQVFYFFIVSDILYIFFLPWGAQLLNKIGLRRSLRISVFLFSGFYISLMLLETNFSVFLSLALMTVVLGRVFFWLPFHTDLARFTDVTNRGKAIGLLSATYIFLGVVMPIISGFIISRYGYNLVFILVVTLYLCSFVPFLTLPSTHEKFSWSYLETIRQFFAKKNRKLVLSNMANGAENDIAVIIWPIFIWQMFKGDFFAVGIISSLIILVAIVLQLFVGNYIDIHDKRKMMHWGSLLYAAGWFAKVFVFTPWQIFIVGTYHNFTGIFKDTPFETLNYELLADKGHFVDEFTIIKEMAIWLGKALILLLSIFVVVNFGLNWTFALAALASLLINLF